VFPTSAGQIRSLMGIHPWFFFTKRQWRCAAWPKRRENPEADPHYC
jgi:hypothetical protein